jgi:Fe-S-cluster containining protein
MAQWRDEGNLANYNHALTLVHKWLTYFRDLPRGKSRAQTAHSVQDRLIADNLSAIADKNPKISCRRGCSACCNIRVSITEDEADLLYDVVVREKIEVDQELLRQQAPWTEDDYPKYFASGQARCVFLDPERGECRVYDVRPMACRSYYVVSDPEMCKPDPDGGGREVLSFIITDVSALETAAASVGIACGDETADVNQNRSLPALLLKRTERGISRYH